MSMINNKTPPDIDLKRLLEYYQNGRYHDAEKLALSITRKFPNHQFCWKVLGALFAQSDRKLKALKANKKSVKLAPQDPEAHSNLGNILQELGRLEKAKASYKKAIILKPDLAHVHYNFGNTLRRLGQLEEAEASYKQAILLDSNYYNAYNNLGIILQDLGRLEESEISYRNAITLKLDYIEAHNNLGTTLQALGKLQEAEVSYNNAIELEPDYLEAYFNLSVTYKELGELEKARESFVKVIALKPNYAEAYYNLGNTLKELDRLEEAESNYKKALEFKPDYQSAKHMLASLTGETPSSSPRVFVENLFDGYASKFDSSLVGKLEYKTPLLIAEILKRQSPERSLGSVLDLGCGTGLVGVEIKELCLNLEGIDVSNLMLRKAKQKNIYDKLLQRDIVEYLLSEELNFDYFISSDVFVYIGDLSDIFRLVKSRNRSNGKLVFTTENQEKDGFSLLKSGRYSHSKTYIEGLCKRFNFTLSYFETVKLRKERGQFISGGVYLLDF